MKIEVEKLMLGIWISDYEILLREFKDYRETPTSKIDESYYDTVINDAEENLNTMKSFYLNKDKKP